MGLDMYLKGKRFLWHNEEQLKQAIRLALPDAPGVPTEVTVEAAYWRKANHIHKWFVDNVQEGEDDCKDYYVSREQLTTLHDLCQYILEHPEEAKGKLPTESGFFFGGTEYDEDYFNDLRNTMKQLKPIIESDNSFKDWDFEYRASW